MAIDERLARQARAAAEHITERQRDLDAARGAFQRTVRALYLDGGSLREIADELGISHQRVHQLLDLPTRSDARGPDRRSTGLVCSFCGRPQSAVLKLICGPNRVGICNDCVVPATAAVQHGSPAEDSRTALTPVAAGTCSFCGKSPGPELAVAESGAVRICAECIDLCHEILVEEQVEPG